ncbi:MULTISPECIES: glycosyltransferase family 4 protein [Actinokineospora]|uniref:Undecaprenyl-phosphate alpha-N-acetylglucosaminyl 1-phosphate transferase n=1 Tax=Actinokineospora fastidiosa TaxID=1816 RepID=A0A918GQW1_9PSEU|nr:MULTISPECIES: MraY family glycosyltransferase [Actinokineospora]UVS81386.1 Decaprenyl-phosphate N-acetylglucosaminephosphotransferase [Actinokineospora sp. UTMC 2448]GGS53185.1 undecaprenyl-phosphate alpha-N-acetylglucosaminyl 1-phosphate transferase [Actinokineospora fastidiosa]
MPPSGYAAAGLPVREYLLVALISAVITFLSTGLVRVFAIRIGAVAYPRSRDVHVVPIPRMGGLAMYLGVCGGMLLAHQLPLLRRAFDFTLDPVAVLVGGGIIVLLGMLDDRFELDSLTKLAGQTTCAGILVLFGIQWFIFWVPWGGAEGSVLVLDQNQGGLLTILLAVTLVNAMNFVDGLDGLAAGIGMIAAAATLAFSLHLLDQSGGDVNNYPPAIIAATLAGACLGFLPHNFQPARIFMGDTGSMLIGLLLAAASTSASGRANPSLWGATETLAVLSPLVIVAAVLFVPILDLLMAIVRRTWRGESPFAPDKMHLHHRLIAFGHSQRRAVLLIYLWVGVIAFGAVAVTVFDVLAVTLGLIGAVVVAAAVSFLPSVRRSK